MLGNILLNPVLGLFVAIVSLQVLVWDANHDLNATASQGIDGPWIGVEKLNLVDSIVLEQANHNARLENVGGLCAPIHPKSIAMAGVEG